MKIVVRLFLLFIVFVGVWLSLSQVNWMEVLEVEKVTDSTEEKLGEIIKKSIEQSEEIVRDKEIENIIDSIVHRISKKNDIDESRLKILIVNNDNVNAFALPNQHLVIFTGLINACNQPEALTGVLAHEMAHIQLNHVMRKLVKEVGMSVLYAATSNRGNSEILGQLTQTLSSSAYDRILEEEADLKAVEYLVNANIDPEPLSNFFYTLSLDKSDAFPTPQWLSTHPDTKERAEMILDYIDENQSYDKVISQSSWVLLKEKVQARDEDM